MALKSTACFSMAENAAIEVSQENLRSILGQIEAELLCSDIYNRALASLRTMLGEAATAAEILMKAVSREAIRLAFQQFPKHSKATLQGSTAGAVAERVHRERTPDPNRTRPAPPPPPVPVSMLYQRQPSESGATATLPQPKPDTSIEDEDGSEKPSSTGWEEFKETNSPTMEAIAVVPTDSKFDSPPPPWGPKNRKKRLTKAEKAVLATQAREESLRQIGKELRKARQVRSLSLQQLQSQTLVPLHHLEALEKGEMDKLPEDIYIRGFIRRVGNALGLDGTTMAASLPAPDLSKTLLPSWSVPELEPSGFCLRPVHLYLGYTALMAGAVGGLAWLSQQPVPGATAVPNKPLPSPPSTPSVQKRQTPTPKPKPGIKKSSHGHIIVGTDIAPPEVFSV